MKKKLMDEVGISDFLKVLKIMRLSTFLLMVFALQAWASSSYSQQQVTLNLKNVKVLEVLNQIESSTNFYFLFNKDLVDVERVVSISANQEEIDDFLTDLFAGTNVKFVVSDRQIVLTTENDAKSQSQQKIISGKVTDSSGTPLPGVTVVVKGTTQGIITDADGKYTLPKVSGDATLVFSFVGMKSQEIAAAGKNSINIKMEEDAIGIDEVVAIGYGTVKKSDLTSSVAKVTDEAIKDRPIMLLGEAFQGQLSGVRSQSSNGGMPGDELTIRIRGINTINGDSDPLYVIDGVPRTNMNDINPNDIASIQILKDASATSIYGARGGNGVVLIETKQGKGKPSISFDAYYGLSKAEKKAPVMSGHEWVAWNMFCRNLAYLRAGGSMSNDMSSRPASYQIPGTWETWNNFTDWQDAVLQAAAIQNYQFSASASGDNGSIYFSAGYMDQDGIILNSYYNRKNIRLNSTLNVSDKIKVGVNLSGASSDKNGGGLDTSTGSNGNGKEAAFHHAIMMSPLMQLDEGTAEWGFPENIGTTYANPVEQLKNTTDNKKYTRIASSIWGSYDILKGLVFKTQYSYNYDGYTYEFYQPGNVTYQNGNVTLGNSAATTTGDWTIQNTLSYDKVFGKDHNLSLLLGQSAEELRYYKIYAAASGWPYETIETLNVATTATSATTNRTSYTNASFFGRANYKYKDKYLLSASLRCDGSSRFGSNSKWGYFPSLSVGWKMNDESFMTGIDWISLLKVRAAIGTSGNDRIGDYEYMSLLGTYNTSWADQVVAGVAPSNIANEDLQWETTTTFDFGFDFNGLKNRIQVNLDYYYNKTTDLLFSVPIPYTTGFSSYTTNIGSLENRGWEVDITSHNIKGKFNWSTSLNLSRNRNKVLDMGDITESTSISWDAYFITEVGGPVSQFYCYETDGVLSSSDFDSAGNALNPTLSGQEEGNVKYVDQPDENGNKDGKINSEDYVAQGTNQPDLIFGLTNRFSWRNFDLSILMQGQYGGEILFLGSRQYDNGGYGRNIYRRWLHCYKPDYEKIYGDGENPVPTEYLEKHGIDFSWDGKTNNPFGTNNNNDDRRIYDSSYLRIKNITFGYTMPKELLRNSTFGSVRCYVSLDNVKTFDSYPGFTPETNSFGNNTTKMGVDYCTYPLSKRCVFGINVTF